MILVICARMAESAEDLNAIALEQDTRASFVINV